MNDIIDWDRIPELISKEQFCRICHVSKSTALYLLQNGVVPCEYTGKKTRCYLIRKEDAKDFFDSKNTSSYFIPKGWYRSRHAPKVPKELPSEVYDRMYRYYDELLDGYKEILTVLDVVKITGYAKSTVNGWCHRGIIKYFRKGNLNYIPKVFLIEFFCSYSFRSITQKSCWHKETIWKFNRSYLGMCCNKNREDE